MNQATTILTRAEYLLGQYCATNDEATIQSGIDTVREIPCSPNCFGRCGMRGWKNRVPVCVPG